MIDHIMNSKQLANKFINTINGSTIEWSNNTIEKWMKSCDDFMKYLMALIHLCSGMPARAPEIAFTSINNTIPSDRSMYMYNRDVMLVQV